MLQNFIKITFRNLLKYKGYSIINIFGLAIGLACTMLILLFVQDEFSYDTYHEHADDIYRVGLDAKVLGNEFKGAVACGPMAATLVAEFPEVVAATRVRNYGFPVLRYKEKVFSEERSFAVDSTFFDVFSAKWLQGNPKSALAQDLQIILTESMAKKYFGDENPIGKIINSDRRRDYTVIGVVEDVPANSHFHYDFLTPLITYLNRGDEFWVSNNFQTYFRLRAGTDYKDFEAKLHALVEKYVGPQLQQLTGVPWEQTLGNAESYYKYFVHPVKDIHLYSNVDFEIEPNSDATYVYIFLIVAISILVIACVNFMNLATARSANRAKEVGVRKSLGSLKGQLILQFLAESIFMSFISVLIALLLVQLVLPQFNNIASKALFIDFSDPLTIPALIALIFFVGTAAGLYPAFYLSSFNPAIVLKEGAQKGGRRKWLRSALVIFQFSISVVLIVGTYIVDDQLQFLQNKKLGFKKDHILIVEKTDDIGQQIIPFKQELLQFSEVEAVSNSNNLFGYDFGNTVYRKEGDGPDVTHIIWNFSVDVDFAETYELEMAAGRFYSAEFTTDTASIVLNESAIKTLGIVGDPIGQNVITPFGRQNEDRVMPIIGVVKDFHFQSLHDEIKPLVIQPFQRGQFGRYVAVKFNSANIGETIRKIESTWLKYANDQAFEYVFFDEEFNRVYTAEFRTGKLFKGFSILGILIACLGLFGLAAFMAEQRTKEIGIRKTMGASVNGLIILLCKEFTKWVIISNLIALPIAYFWMTKWLENFAYRIDITFVAFFVSAILSLIIALITVSYQAVKASLANPIDSLKYE